MSRWDEYDRMQERVLEGRSRISENNHNRHVPSQDELDEWNRIVASIKEQIRSGVKSTEFWKINGSWVDVNGGRSFFLGNEFIQEEKISPEKPRTPPISEPPPKDSIITPPKKQSSHQKPKNEIKKDKSLAELFFAAIGALFILLVISSLIAYQFREKSCADLISEAWEDCNDDYNGKCRYLGPKYSPNCYPDEDDDYDSRREY